VLGLAGLDNAARKRAGGFSHGMTQRQGIAASGMIVWKRCRAQITWFGARSVTDTCFTNAGWASVIRS
jgi:hypothetical protein